MNVAAATIDLPLSAVAASSAWDDFEGLHVFLVDDSPESFDEASLRAAAKLGKGLRFWMQVEASGSQGAPSQWRGVPCQEGTSLVRLEPLDNGKTRLRVEIPAILHGGVEASQRAIRRTSERLQNDLRKFCHRIGWDPHESSHKKSALGRESN